MPLIRIKEGTKSVHVKIDGRTFIARFDSNNEVLRIAERKTSRRYGVDMVYDAVYWNPKNHKLGAEWTLPRRIIAAAREKLNAAS